ncbi:NUDIX hydrolase [Ignatzschineria sp. LJL83]
MDFMDKSPTQLQEEGTTELVAVLIAVTNSEAKVLTVDHGETLPNGPLTPIHRSLQAGVRQWVETQTHQPMGYVEQLYTFVDTNRQTASGHYLIYISYLGLVREETKPLELTATWQNWYEYFPWEDHRKGYPESITTEFMPIFHDWINAGKTTAEQKSREQRVNLCWGVAPFSWNEEYVLQRYELLYEMGILPESTHDISKPAHLHAGKPMNHDHRRVLASAMARLRAKIKYRPVIFELMPPTFTLLQLQQSIEALAGITLHKQNFRRFITQQELIEETDKMDHSGPGRPAKLYQFKEDILLERSLSGSKLPISR